MMDYLEKQIIIDYHLRGEQDLLKEQNPKLDKAAKKFFGYEDYYEFSLLTGPMPQDHPKFEKLIQTANELNIKIEKDLEKFYGQPEMLAAAKADAQKVEAEDPQPEEAQKTEDSEKYRPSWALTQFHLSNC